MGPGRIWRLHRKIDILIFNSIWRCHHLRCEAVIFKTEDDALASTPVRVILRLLISIVMHVLIEIRS